MNNFLRNPAKYRALARCFAKLVRKPTGFPNKLIMGLFVIIIFTNCAATRHYNFSLKDTLSVFMVNNGKAHYFCIPVQYTGEYQINSFEFDSGYILIGDYELLLKRDDIKINIYLNEENEEFENSDGKFNLIHSEENGRILFSKMSEPLSIRYNSDGELNYYYIFIEKHLKNDDIEKIINEYEKGNVYSRLYIGYDMSINNDPQPGYGMFDDFELYNGTAIDPALFPQNLDFFKAKYLQ